MVLRKFLFGLGLAVVSLSANALAEPVQITIGPYSVPGFSASWVHTASSKMNVGGIDFWPGGSTLHSNSLTGVLTATRTGATNLSNVAGVLSANNVTLVITGGEFSTGGAITNGEGFLNFDLTVGADPTISGTFHFFDQAFPGPPQQLTSEQLVFWGNNWLNNVQTKQQFVGAGGTPLGLDLYASIEPIPEPATLLLLSSGLIGMGLRRRRL